METDMVHELTATFEVHTQQTENGVEFWLARDLQHFLGYAEWRNFTTVISKAKTACEVSGHSIGDHFVDVNKMVDLGSESRRQPEFCFDTQQRRPGSIWQIHTGNEILIPLNPNQTGKDVWLKNKKPSKPLHTTKQLARTYPLLNINP